MLNMYKRCINTAKVSKSLFPKAIRTAVRLRCHSCTVTVFLRPVKDDLSEHIGLFREGGLEETGTKSDHLDRG